MNARPMYHDAAPVKDGRYHIVALYDRRACSPSHAVDLIDRVPAHEVPPADRCRCPKCAAGFQQADEYEQSETPDFAPPACAGPDSAVE